MNYVFLFFRSLFLHLPTIEQLPATCKRLWPFTLQTRASVGVLCLLLFACSQGKRETANPPITRVANGKTTGGTFRLSESEYIKTLYPHAIVDVYSYRVAVQLFEGLVKFSNNDVTRLKPALAKSWETDDSGKVYTFYLKEGVRFHNDPCFASGQGRELTAEDVAWCFTRLCMPHRLNQNFHLFKDVVKGASEFYKQCLAGKQPAGYPEGFRVLDRHTFQIELKQPRSTFLYNLARPGAMVFPREAWQHYGEDMRINPVGTGPFVLGRAEEGIELMLLRNKNYYGTDSAGNQLPFMDAINIKFIRDKKMEWLEFKKGRLDMIYRLPPDHTLEILDEIYAPQAEAQPGYTVQREPEMSTQCLIFNTFRGVFADKHIRKAFNFAIDRKRILNYVLNGEGYDIGRYGFTPPGFPNYPVNELQGYGFNLDSARFYLKKAGYGQGKPFPQISLLLNPEGERHIAVATEIQKQLKDHLNITMSIDNVPMAQLADRSIKGDFDLMRLAWIADYPNPENYLWKFYSRDIPANSQEPSYPNFSRYRNSCFDSLYEKALAATDEATAMRYFLQAEAQMLADAPLLVLWYDEGYRLLQPRVQNFANNPMQYRDFSEVYLLPGPEKNL